MKRKVIQFQKLSALMTRVLACFDSGKTGAELHSCVVDAGMEADAGEKSAQGIIPSTGSASGLGRAADVGQIALSFSPPPGKAFVYVIRPERLFRKDETFGANLDSEPFGTLNNGFYLFAALAPGEHSLEGYYQLHSFLGGNQIVGPPLKFTAESGKNYYFKIKLPGLIGGPAVEQTSETDGKALVQPGKLSPDNSFGH